jgi:hypothetical protein
MGRDPRTVAVGCDRLPRKCHGKDEPQAKLTSSAHVRTNRPTPRSSSTARRSSASRANARSNAPSPGPARVGQRADLDAHAACLESRQPVPQQILRALAQDEPKDWSSPSSTNSLSRTSPWASTITDVQSGSTSPRLTATASPPWPPKTGPPAVTRPHTAGTSPTALTTAPADQNPSQGSVRQPRRRRLAHKPSARPSDRF